MNLLFLFFFFLRLFFLNFSLLRLSFLLLFLWLSLGLLLLLRLLFLRFFLEDRIKLCHFSSGFLLEEGFHLLQLNSSRFISVKKVKKIAPICLIHEDVAVFKAFSQLSGLNCSTSVNINNQKEFIKSYSAAQNNILNLTNKLLFPHRSVLMPILKNSFELFQAESFSALCKTCDSMH